MRIHREGHVIILIATFLIGSLLYLGLTFLPLWAGLPVAAGLLFLEGLILQFFRNPKRSIANADDRLVFSPADGKVVVIEETEETEYFNEKRLQVSIFMSIWDVHLNRNPVSGKVTYRRHHPGKYLVAWHPKSSSENERMTTVYDTGKGEILVRQIAGAVARRIRNYLQVGQQVAQGSEMGFIKFGSRVDIFLPLDAKVQVQIGQHVQGNADVIAHLK